MYRRGFQSMQNTYLMWISLVWKHTIYILSLSLNTINKFLNSFRTIWCRNSAFRNYTILQTMETHEYFSSLIVPNLVFLINTKISFLHRKYNYLTDSSTSHSFNHLIKKKSTSTLFLPSSLLSLILQHNFSFTFS